MYRTFHDNSNDEKVVTKIPRSRLEPRPLLVSLYSTYPKITLKVDEFLYSR